MLAFLEGLDLAETEFGTVDGLNFLTEVLKMCVEDRRQHRGDPAFAEVPVDVLMGDSL